MLLRQSGFLRGDRKWGCCEDLIAPPGLLLTPYPHNNRKHIPFFIYFLRNCFCAIPFWTTKVKRNVPRAGWKHFTTPKLTSWRCFLMEPKVPRLCRPARCFICNFPRQGCILRANGEPDIKLWQTGQQSWASKQTGGISLTQLRRASDHSERLLI